MTDRKSGISDKALVEDSGGSEITDDIGWVDTASHTITNNSEKKASVNSGSSYAYILDGQIDVEGALTARILDLKALKLLGTYEEDTEAGTWEVSLDDELPTHTFKQKITEGTDRTILLKDFKFGRAVIRLNKGEEVTIDFEGMGKDAEVQETDISPTEPSDEPLSYLDATVKIGGTAVGSLDSGSITYTRSLEAVRGIEDTSARTATELIEKLKDFTFDLTFEITDGEAWERAFGTSSYPLSTQEDRDNTTVSIVLGDTEGTIELSDARANDVENELASDGEIRTATITGDALDATVSGDL